MDFSPKSTGYEALHTVMGPKGRWVEVQRSERMDEIAEKDMQLITNIKWATEEGGLMFG
jgi:hypothetical protein